MQRIPQFSATAPSPSAGHRAGRTEAATPHAVNRPAVRLAEAAPGGPENPGATGAYRAYDFGWG